MSNHVLIADAHTLANQQLERLTILLLLLPEGRENLPECQQNEVDAWMFEMVGKAQESINAARDAAANLREGLQ